MNYMKPELLDALAGEYVLGTLTGKARQRFERLIGDSFQVRQRVWQWEQKLVGLMEYSSAVLPPDEVWQRIAARTFKPAARTTTPAIGLWRWWTAAASAVAVVLAIMLVTQPEVPTPAQWNNMALLSDANSQPVWLVTADTQSGTLRVKALNDQATAVDNKAFELWMLPSQGSPKSLGLLPVAQREFKTLLSPQLLTLLQQSAKLAVSLEPAGGSPTGSPTGPVVFTAPIVKI